MHRSGWRSSLAAALLLATVGLGHSQQPANPETPPTARTVNLSLEQRHVIRELLKETKTAPAATDAKFAAGDQVPAAVELHAMPPLIGQKVPQIKSHRFYVTQAQIVIVDPKDRKVVEVIE